MGTKKIISFVVAVILILPIFASSGDVPVTLKTVQKYNELYRSSYPEFMVTSLKDDIVISKITINKGNCKFIDVDIMAKNLNKLTFLPKKLKEDEEGFFSGGLGCKVKTVDMTIDNVEWTFSF